MKDIVKLELGRDRLRLWGPQVEARIGHQPHHSAEQVDISLLLPTGYPALIDTGARENFVDVSVVARHGLRLTSETTVSWLVDGEDKARVYLGHLHLPALDVTILDEFAAVPIIDNGLPYSVIVGRNFLRHRTFVYDGVKGAIYFLRGSLID